MGLLTNSYRSFLEMGLDKIELENCFNKTIAADDGFNSKQEGCLSLIKHFKSRENTTLYIGDTNHDITIAKKVGCKVAIVLNPSSWGWSQIGNIKKSNPDIIISSLFDLPKVLESSV